MKTRIFGAILVIGILVVLYLLTENASTAPQQSVSPMSSPSDADFKALKIN